MGQAPTARSPDLFKACSNHVQGMFSNAFPLALLCVAAWFAGVRPACAPSQKRLSPLRYRSSV
eukprot:14578591-Alexandrium_andersonii.AAC.1